MVRKPNQQSIAWFYDLYTRGLLNLDPPYQRRSVWNQAFKDYFIDTILLQYPAPSIFLFEEISPDGRARYHVVDGKQRLTTIFSFIANEFPVSEVAERSQLRGQFFKSLEDNTKREFWTYQFSVEYLPTDDESIINNIFDRINRNTSRLTAQELRHAKFGGLFITTAEELAEWLATQLSQGFPNITPRSRSQMKDVEFVAHLLLLLELGPRGYSTLQLDQAFADRDSEWEGKGEVVEKFQKAIGLLKTLISSPAGQGLDRTRLRNQADFYSLFGAIAELSESGSLPDLSKWGTRLKRFIDTVEDDERRASNREAKQYYEAARSASNDAGPRKERISILKTVLEGSLGRKREL